ncbi:MAG TPA: ABC transporter substrate-binding protein [Candidatus Binatia bacterium]|jgi:ABC-type nitrate/sulfonate/bicarbonate transport system substrate-binding protein|nr:ABC transporter substrate-binding protein [Candidatus Binatia bacterium]
MQTKKFALISALVGLLLLASELRAQERLKKIRVTYPTESIAVLPLFAAVKWKTFEENDLLAEIIQARSQVANAALASGEIGYFAGVGPASISATLRGLQSRAVWFASDEIVYLLLARPEFSNIRDLRNKKIGLTGLGGTSHVALQIAMESLGENPKNFIYLSITAAQTMAALETGVIDAALLSPPYDFYAKKKGFREVLNVGSYARMPFGGLTTMISTMRGRPDELKRVIRALQIAKQEMIKSKEKTVALVSSFLKVDREAAEGTYAAYVKTVSGNGVPTRDGIDQIIKSLQMAGQFTDRKVTFEEVADDRIAKEVAKELGYRIN